MMKINRSKIVATARAFGVMSISRTHHRDIFLQLTEGRDDWTGPDGQSRHYGWCGDFVTASLYCAGCSDGRVLNRATLNGGHWVPGDNLARVHRWASAHSGIIDPASMEPGDIIQFDRQDGGHTGVFLNWTGSESYESGEGNTWGRVSAVRARLLSGKSYGGLPGLKIARVISAASIPFGGPVTVGTAPALAKHIAGLPRILAMVSESPNGLHLYE